MSNDIEKMTRKSQEAMQAAALLAERKGNPSVEPEHLLLELVQQSEGIVPRLLDKLGVPQAGFLADLRSRIDRYPQVSGGAQKTLASTRLEKLFKLAEKEAQDWGDSFISTEHFLLAMLRSGDAELGNQFKKYHLTTDGVKKALSEIRSLAPVALELLLKLLPSSLRQGSKRYPRCRPLQFLLSINQLHEN